MLFISASQHAAADTLKELQHSDLKLTFWRRNYFLILAHAVYKMWIIQEPNTLELWNKLHFEKKNTESILTYLLTPWCRVLLEKLTGLQLVKKFPGFHGTRRFITALTSVRHLSLSWANPIQSTYPHPTSWRSILILSTHLRLCLPSGLLPSGFPTRPYTPPLLPHTRHIPSPSHSSRFYHPHNIGWGVQIT